MAIQKKTGVRKGLHRTDAGLVHTATSLADGARGIYQNKFDEPGPETEGNVVDEKWAKDKTIAGSQPHLGSRFMKGGRQ